MSNAIDVRDDKLGFIGTADLAPGQSKSFTKTAFIKDSVVNVATATSSVDDLPCEVMSNEVQVIVN